MNASKLLGWRKTGYWAGSVLVLVAASLYLHASFTEFRDGIVVLAGLVLGAHVTQQATTKTPAAAAAVATRSSALEQEITEPIR